MTNTNRIAIARINACFRIALFGPDIVGLADPLAQAQEPHSQKLSRYKALTAPLAVDFLLPQRDIARRGQQIRGVEAIASPGGGRAARAPLAAQYAFRLEVFGAFMRELRIEAEITTIIRVKKGERAMHAATAILSIFAAAAAVTLAITVFANS